MEITDKTTTSNSERAKHRIEQLHKLHLMRTTARKLNHGEVVAEDARNKLPSNFEARQRQTDWLIANEKGKTEAAAKGLDYDRIKLLQVSAVEAANIEKKKRKKQPDDGFTGYEVQTARKYSRLVSQMPPPDMEKYHEMRRKVGDDVFYRGANAISQHLHKDAPRAIDNMVNDLEKQIMKRSTFSRRRTHNEDADIDYISEKNARFNKKLERSYGQYTTEIKQNLERGTAL